MPAAFSSIKHPKIHTYTSVKGIRFGFPFFCYHGIMIELFGTLGPSCRDPQTLIRMFQEGMNGMRLNLSHASLKESSELIRCYHDAAAEAGVKGELLVDLQGPELRLGLLDEPMELKEHALLETDDLPLPECVLDALEEQDVVLLDDGKIELTCENHQFFVRRGGLLTSRKSIKIIGKDLPMPALTQTDRENLAAAKEFGVSAVMQPFVRNADDLLALKEELKRCGCSSIRIFSKIENRTGLEHLEEIIANSDMIVIARGDLGNDVPLSELPGVQKDIAAACRKQNVPFLVVTQMLTSMIHSPIPTRAEVSDIFNAVTDGASAVMVTNETAVGDYPAEVIKVLYDTAGAAERWLKTHTSER